METKHTPGPWTVAPDAEGEPDFFSVWYDVEGTGAEIAGRIGEPANASLIAAAPDLLAALAAMRGELDVMSGYWTEHMDTLAQMADAAIAKARGTE